MQQQLSPSPSPSSPSPQSPSSPSSPMNVDEPDAAHHEDGEIRPEGPPKEYLKIWELARNSLDTYDRRDLLVNETNITVFDSDGDKTRWPFAEPENVSDEGEVHYLTFADAEREASWKRKIGTALVAILGLSQPGKKYTLTGFPSGYVLYVRKTGQKDSPRKDYYLYGSESVIVFRSPYEFVMHALWLAQGKPRDDDDASACLCKYCGPVKSQLAISSLWTGKIRTRKPRRRGREAPRVIVQREHEGIGGAVWTELQHDSDSE